MPLKLHSPGSRKGNPFYLIRGQVRGQRYEISTGTTDHRIAQKRLAETNLAIASGDESASRAAETFGGVADLYIGAKNPAKANRVFIEKLCAVIGDERLPIQPMVVQRAARTSQQPGRTWPVLSSAPALRTPAAIMHATMENRFIEGSF